MHEPRVYHSAEKELGSLETGLKLVQAINWRDEKLYKIAPRDYGEAFTRAIGVVLYSAVKGTVIAVGILIALFDGRLIASPRAWLFFVLPLAAVCGVWAAFSDRCLFVCEIEIFPDRIIRHSGDKTIGIGRSQVISIKDGGHWTLFGRSTGLTIRTKENSIFIPADCPDYAEIRAKLGAWENPIA